MLGIETILRNPATDTAHASTIYTLSYVRNGKHWKAGRVEVLHTEFPIKTAYTEDNEPISVDSPRYRAMMEAVREYEEWAARH